MGLICAGWMHTRCVNPSEALPCSEELTGSVCWSEVSDRFTDRGGKLPLTVQPCNRATVQPCNRAGAWSMPTRPTPCVTSLTASLSPALGGSATQARCATEADGGRTQTTHSERSIPRSCVRVCNYQSSAGMTPEHSSGAEVSAPTRSSSQPNKGCIASSATTGASTRLRQYRTVTCYRLAPVIELKVPSTPRSVLALSRIPRRD